MNKPTHSISLPAGLFLLMVLLFPAINRAQTTIPSGIVTVDDQGIMRWASGEEVQGFGVNYTTPFAHAFRSAKKLGIDPLKAIDQDVYHFKRLGFDLYRCHVWDTEISDTLGNLLYNEHLHAFDYLLKKLSDNNIRYVLTPIAYWGNGWPEPDQDTPGFSNKYGKGDCLTHPDAIAAQENYLTQFMNHVNPYTGVAYKDDPNLIAVEISNEPHHGGEGNEVTAFVRKMVEAVKRTGYKKPVFYNISHSVHFVNDYFAGGIDGGTFQWYPTGLVYNKELPINALPNVDHYHIPFEEDIKKYSGAKLVYEFDAADINKSYPYVAMARSFRKAGIQIATHFCYDPTFLAYANTEYNTHYMNLAYTPGKAIGLMIAGEVFHRIPLYKDFGTYPDNTHFAGFSVSYEKDLAQLNVPEAFYYSNDTEDVPVNVNALQHLAGVGQSPIVKYQGTGAYFLDKLDEGVWRLEVMPDALTVQNPFGRNSLQKTVGIIQWNTRVMSVSLPDLEKEGQLIPLNPGNDFSGQFSADSFAVRPGTFLLTTRDITSNQIRQWEKNHPNFKAYAGPPANIQKDWLVHSEPKVIPSGKDIPIYVQVASPQDGIKVKVLLNGIWRDNIIELQHQTGFTFKGMIPADKITGRTLSYYLLVEHGSTTYTYPSGAQGMPWDWDFHHRKPYESTLVDASRPLVLFDAVQDSDDLSRSRWSRSIRLTPGEWPHEAYYEVNLDPIFPIDYGSPKGTRNFTLRHFLKERLHHWGDEINRFQTVHLRAKALNDKPVIIQLTFITSEGHGYGAKVTVQPGKSDYFVPIPEFKPLPIVTMPRPYPTFLPYFFQTESNQSLDLSKVEALDWSLGPGIPNDPLNEKHGVGVSYVLLKD